jgi:hypothetical protein
VLRFGPAIVPAALAAAVLLVAPASALAAEPTERLDTLWNEFPLEQAPAVERLESPPVAPLSSVPAPPVGGDSNELPLGLLLGLAAAAAAVALAVRAAGTHVLQEHISAGLDRLGTRDVPRLHVPRPRVPEIQVPRPEIPRPRLPRLPSNRLVESIAETLERCRRTVWHADVLFWTSAMAAATAFGILIAFILGGP